MIGGKDLGFKPLRWYFSAQPERVGSRIPDDAIDRVVYLQVFSGY